MSSLLLLKSMLFPSVLPKSKKKRKKKLIKMLSPKKTVTNMCRLCNNEPGCIPIFDNLANPNISDEINHFTGIIISTSDDFSKFICQGCLDSLIACIVFREMCQLNNKRLIEMAVKKESSDCKDFEGNSIIPDNEDLCNIPSPALSEDKTDVWNCSSCSTDFLDMNSFDDHVVKCKAQIKEDAKPVEVTKKKFLCDTCGKTAYSNASLLIHMGTHENIFPFKCEICPYQGRTMDLLKVHKRSHLTDKPYKCTQCPKATTTASNLAKHMRHVHSTTRPHKCSYCEKAFSYQHDMKRHIKDIHLRQGTVNCDICFKKFNTKKILQGHRWKIHKIKGERQGRLPSYLQHVKTEIKQENNSRS